MSIKEDINFYLKLGQILASMFVGFGIMFYSIYTSFTNSSVNLTKFILDLKEQNISSNDVSLIMQTAKLFQTLSNNLPYITFFFMLFFGMTIFCIFAAIYLKIKSKMKII